MALVLKPDMVLEKSAELGCVLLYRKEHKNRDCKDRERSNGLQPIFHLHPAQGLILASFDGARSQEKVVEYVSAAASSPPASVRKGVRATVSRFRQFLAERQEIKAPLPETCEPAEYFFATSWDARISRQAAPQTLQWIVTESCDKLCCYCYKDSQRAPDDRASDLELSFERLQELAAEAQQIGVCSLILSGGEPFLRPDLVEVMQLFTERGIEVRPITKARLSREQIKGMAQHGLTNLHVSLDSDNASTVDWLTGTPGAFEQMLETITLAVEGGIPVVLRPLMTRTSVRHLERLVKLTYDIGVRHFMVDIYGESCGRNDQGLELTSNDQAWLKTAMVRLQERFADAQVCFYHTPVDESQSKSASLIGAGCVEGTRGLTFLPNGIVTKCEHWRFGDQLIYGDLRSQSIMEAWDSEVLRRLNSPPKALFAETVCAQCKEFDHCSDIRGRCSFTALHEYGTVFAPDSSCPIGVFKKGHRR